MKNTFMVSAAVAALIGATALATAQGVAQKESPATAWPKADTSAPMNAHPTRDAATPGAASKEQAPQHVQSKPDAKTTGEIKVDGKSKASDSNASGTASKDMKSPSAETKMPAAENELKSDTKAKASDTTTISKDMKTPSAETKPADSKTTGNAATSATAAPPAEKRTQISSAIRQEKVEEVTNINFNVTVGTAVPAGVRYHPLPSRIVDIYPEWLGYEFIVVRGKYVILRPHTHEIVYIIEG